MWRKQEEPKPASSAPDLVVRPTPVAPHPQESRPVAVSAPAAAPSGLITKSMQFRGEISGDEDLYVDGEVRGKIRIPNGKVTVGPNGRVNSDIEAREIHILGEAEGLLRGAERVFLGRTARASGDILTRRIAIEEGATFTGRVEVVRPEEAPAENASTGNSTAKESMQGVAARAQSGQA